MAITTYYNFLGQKVSLGSMFYGQFWPDEYLYYNTDIATDPIQSQLSANKIAFPSPRAFYSFMKIGAPFYIWDWIISKTEGIIPATITKWYFNAEAEEVTLSDPYTFVICLYYSGGMAYALAGLTSNELDSHWLDLISYQNNNLLYYGADTSTISEDDRNAATYFFFEPQTEKLPDLTKYPQTVTDNIIGGFMNGEVRNRAVSTFNDFTGSMSTCSALVYGYTQSFGFNYSYASGSEYAWLTYYGPRLVKPDPVWSLVPGVGPYTYDESMLYGHGTIGYAVRFIWSDATLYPFGDVVPNTPEQFPSDPTPPGVPVDNPPGGDSVHYNDEEGSAPPEDDEIPDNGVSNTMMSHLYTPTRNQLTLISRWLWTDDFIDVIKKAFQDPFQAIIALMQFPIKLTPYQGDPVNIVIGNVENSDIQTFPLLTDYIELDFGLIELFPRWNTSLDFAPFTKLQAYLPFIGYVDIDPSEVYRTKGGAGALHLIYNVNLFTGDCVAKLYATSNLLNDDLIATYCGNCALQIPLSSANYTAFYKNLITTGISAATGFISGGITGALTGAATGALHTATSTGVTVQRSGNMSGGAAMLQYLKAFVYRITPNQSYSQSYKYLTGLPANRYGKISTFKGYTVFERVKLDGFRGTDAEASELKNLLMEGIYI